MEDWKKFKTFKQRGEWVELEFMAAASLRGYHVLKPCGDNLNYDVAIDHCGSILRVQVKGFSARKGQGYLARLRHGGSGKQRYSPADLDLFALYILPPLAWYLIPSAAVLRPKPKMFLTFYPDGPPSRIGRHTPDHDYEPYRNAWHLLTKSRSQLSRRRAAG
jgi:hypothetical protein